MYPWTDYFGQVCVWCYDSVLYCAGVKFLCSPSWWNNNGVCNFRNVIYLFHRWIFSDFLSRIKAHFFIFIYQIVQSTELLRNEIFGKDINQDTYYTLDSGMKFIIWPWQHNLTSFTQQKYNSLTTFLYISPCFLIIQYFQICFYFSIIYHYYLLKVSNLFHVPCNHRFQYPRSQQFLKWHFLKRNKNLDYYIALYFHYYHKGMKNSQEK